MAATVLIVLWVQNEFSFDRFQPDVNKVYRVTAKLKVSKNETWIWEDAPYVLGDFVLREIPEVELVTRLKPNNYAENFFHYNGNIIAEKNSAYVDGQWFNMFHYDFIEGSADAFLKNPFSLIITASTAKKYFGTQDAVGKVLRLDTVNYQVQAVVKDNPANSSFQYNVLIPVAAALTDPQAKKNDLTWNNYEYITFLKLKTGTNLKSVSAKMTGIVQKNKKDDNGETTLTLVGVKDMHFESNLQNSAFVHGNKTITNVFIVLAALLLFTACINYVNLTTARASIRSKEVSIRKIIGAGRLQLFMQFMSESFLVSLMSIIVAILFVQLSLPWFRAFTNKNFSNLFITPIVWLIICVTLFITFLLNGIYPAILLSSFEPLKVFKGKSILNFKDSGLRRLLVITQFSISVILIIGTLVIYNQLRFMRNTDPGYNRQHIFTFQFPWWTIKGIDYKKSDALLNTVKEQLRSKGAIADVSMLNGELVNFDSKSSGSFDWAGRPKDFNPTFASLQVDQHFQKMMNLKVKEGRWFNNEPADKHNILLNETAVNTLNLRKPILGQRFIHQGDTGVIIGVLKDFFYSNLHEKIGAMIISQNTGSAFYIKTFPGNEKASTAAAQKVFKTYFPDAPFNYNFLDDSFSKLYKTEQQSSLLIGLFALIAIMVSALGLLGLAAFAAEQKSKEIGIRKVLGATVQNIVAMLSADFLKMVVLASVIAFPIAWYFMNKWLQDFAYRINFSWWIFALAAGIALIITLVTVTWQSIKAAIANPVKSLRSE